MIRFWGLIPLLGVGWAYLDYGGAAELLWACNVAAGLLGVGLLARSPRAVWSGTVVLVGALFLWLPWVLSGQEEGWHALVTHVLSPGLGLWALRGMARPPDLLLGVGLGWLGVGGLSRWLTPAELDVNFVFQPLLLQGGLFLGTLCVLAAVARGLERLAPEQPRDPLLLALDLGDPGREQAFFDHFARASRRGPGDKRALKALLAQSRGR